LDAKFFDSDCLELRSYEKYLSAEQPPGEQAKLLGNYTKAMLDYPEHPITAELISYRAKVLKEMDELRVELGSNSEAQRPPSAFIIADTSNYENLRNFTTAIRMKLENFCERTCAIHSIDLQKRNSREFLAIQTELMPPFDQFLFAILKRPLVEIYGQIYPPKCFEISAGKFDDGNAPENWLINAYAMLKNELEKDSLIENIDGIKKFYDEISSENAREIGADNLVTWTWEVMKYSGPIARLNPLLHLLEDFLSPAELSGELGYCLTTIQTAFEYLNNSSCLAIQE